MHREISSHHFSQVCSLAFSPSPDICWITKNSLILLFILGTRAPSKPRSVVLSTEMHVRQIGPVPRRSVTTGDRKNKKRQFQQHKETGKWPWLKRKAEKRGVVFHLSSICVQQHQNRLVDPQVAIIWSLTLLFLLLFCVSLCFQMKVALQ